MKPRIAAFGVGFATGAGVMFAGMFALRGHPAALSPNIPEDRSSAVVKTVAAMSDEEVQRAAENFRFITNQGANAIAESQIARARLLLDLYDRRRDDAYVQRLCAQEFFYLRSAVKVVLEDPGLLTVHGKMERNLRLVDEFEARHPEIKAAAEGEPGATDNPDDAQRLR